MLILHPPLCKPCEPPAALAYLAAALRGHGHPCTVCDMNIEGIDFLLKTTAPANDTWSIRACKHLLKHIGALLDLKTYTTFDRYVRAVADLNRVLEIAGNPVNIQLSLANYQDNTKSPVQSDDLRQAAADYRTNIFYAYFSEKLDDLCRRGSHDTIGFSLSYLSQAFCTFAMIGYLRANYPEKTIILGGGLVTTWLSNPQWHNPFADLVHHFIPGQGERPLLRLLGTCQNIRPVRPDFHTLTSYRYLSPGFILPYATSFGCFWKKCSFCPENSERNPYQQIPQATVVAELKMLVEETKPALIHLLDNAISPATLRALTEHPPGVPWYGFARIDKTLASLDFCHRLRAAGCVMLNLGLESGDQAVLDTMNKGIDLHQAAKVLENLQTAGIATYIYLLFGTPSETWESAERTRLFVEEHHQSISFLNIAIFNLPSGSPEVAALEVDDFYAGDLSIYRSFCHPLGWNRAEVRRYLDSTFKRSPKIAAIIKRDPPVFTSNHAPFMSSF